MNEKLKVVWICHFSNEMIYNKIQYNLKISVIKRILAKLIFNKNLTKRTPDFAIWVTNGIQEMEKINDIELHVISPYHYLKNMIQEFEMNNIHYHFFHTENEDIVTKIKERIFKCKNLKFLKNRKIISCLIKKIKPDIIHLIGAENPYYSLSLLDVPDNIPSIVQLQTLMNDPDFLKNYNINNEHYLYRANIEKKIINKANFIGTIAVKYRKIIKEYIHTEAKLLSLSLPLTEPIFKDRIEKQFDFVYFASDIKKAADLALEAFGIVYLQNKSIKLDIIGGYDIDFKRKLDNIINKYGMENAITFEGKLPTHNDVIRQIRKSRYALLPLKVDLTSGTVREAMANGLPVLTTDTGELGTRKLNLKRQNVLISSIGDHNAMADNIQKILYDDKFAAQLRQNAYLTTSERRSNETVIKKYVMAYKACIDNFKYNIPLPNELIEL